MSTKLGIQLSEADFDKIKSMLHKTSYGVEFEGKIKIPSKITREKFRQCLAHLASYGKTMRKDNEVLDISVNGMRVSIKGPEAISLYCKTNSFNEIKKNTIIMKKRSLDRMDVYNYPIRISLSSETNVGKETEQGVFILENSSKVNKLFRLKKRFSVFTDDDLFRVDFTVVRSFSGEKIANVMSNAHESFEIEVEYIGQPKPKNSNKVIESFFDWLAEILSSLDGQEYVLSTQKKDEVLANYISIVSRFIFPSDNEHIQLKKAQYFMTKYPKKLFIGPQPVTLERVNVVDDPVENTISILSDYTVTEKADGERSLVFIDTRGDVFMINNRLQVKATNIKCTRMSYTNSVFDAEFIHNIKLICCFDAYIINNESISDLPLMTSDGKKSRYDLLQQIFTKGNFDFSSSSVQIHVKEFHLGTNTTSILEHAKNILSNAIMKWEYKIDGLVFTPAKLAVGASIPSDNTNFGGTWRHVFKWKPPQDNTIDFLLKIEMSPDGKSPITSRRNGLLYKHYGLYVGSPITTPKDYFENMFNNTGNTQNNSYIKRRFLPPDVVDPLVGTYLCQVENEQTNFKFENGDEITDECIVEMAYNIISRTWEPKRVRHDKTEEMLLTKNISANSYENALIVWKSIMYPIDETHITGKVKITRDMLPHEDAKYYARTFERFKSSSYTMLTFHNLWVKDLCLISKFKNKNSLLDLCCGKAGDLNKWINAGFKTVIGIDLNEDNIINHADGAYKRLASDKRISKDHLYAFISSLDAGKVITQDEFKNIKDDFTRNLADILWGYKAATNYMKPFNSICKNKFDVVSCQFAIHYFFKDDNSLDGFIQNVNNHMKDGGYFIGTCFDGEIVANMLKDVKQNEFISAEKNGKLIWKITKDFQEYQPKVIGQSIHVYVETINQTFQEYLVDFEHLKDKLSEYDIHLLDAERCEKLGIQYPSTGTFKSLFQDLQDKMQSPHSLAFKLQKSLKDVLEMSDEEKTFSFMNRWFVFRKTPNSKLVPVLKNNPKTKQSMKAVVNQQEEKKKNMEKKAKEQKTKRAKESKIMKKIPERTDEVEIEEVIPEQFITISTQQRQVPHKVI